MTFLCPGGQRGPPSPGGGGPPAGPVLRPGAPARPERLRVQHPGRSGVSQHAALCTEDGSGR